MFIQIFAHPNSKKPRVQKDLLGSLHIYVNQPPLENKANMAVIEALAGHFKVSRSRIKLIRGEKSKIKLFNIETK